MKLGLLLSENFMFKFIFISS